MDLQFPLISEVVRQYLTTKKTAEVDLDAVDPHVYVGVASQKNAARQELESIARKLRELVDLDSAGVIPFGPADHQDAFAGLCQDEADAFVIDANVLYQDIAKLVEPFLGPGRTFTAETARALHAALVRVGTALKLLAVTMPFVHEKLNGVYATPEEFLAAIKELVRKANGDDLACIYIAHRVFEQVLEREYQTNVVPVVIIGATEEEARGDFAIKLFGGRTVAVNVSNPPAKNDALLALKTIHPMFKRAAAVQAALGAAKARAAKAQKRTSSDDVQTSTADQATTNEAE